MEGGDRERDGGEGGRDGDENKTSSGVDLVKHSWEKSLCEVCVREQGRREGEGV